MNNVYITESTFKQLIKKIQISEYLETNLPYYERLKSILAIPERKQLVKYAKLLEDLKELDKYQSINTNYSSDPKTRLIFYKKKAPSYHLSKDCTYLNSDYENYEIPVEIKEDDIEKYRKYFLANKSLYEKNRIAFLGKIEIIFNVIIKNVKEIHDQNSGIKKAKNFRNESPDIILTRISILIDEMEAYRTTNTEIEQLIKKVGFATHRAKYMNSDGEYMLYLHDKASPVYHWHIYKIKLKSLIEKYFISTLNSEFKFKVNILEQCGLVCCRACSEIDSIIKGVRLD